MLQNPKLMITESDQVQLASYLPYFFMIDVHYCQRTSQIHRLDIRDVFFSCIKVSICREIKKEWTRRFSL